MVVGDFDNDGSLDDIAIAKPGGTGTLIRVFRNGGVVDDGNWIDSDLDLTRVNGRIAIADLDGDGFSDDIVMGRNNPTTNDVRFFRYTGDGGQFTQASSLQSGYDPATVEDHMVVADNGDPLVLGSHGEQVGLWMMSGNGWTYQGIGRCCLTGASRTPTGFVAVGNPYDGGASYVLSSNDGITWMTEDLEFAPLTGVSWTEGTQLIATTKSASVLLGPSPYP